MVGCMIVSLVLIVVLVILQKKLPDGAGSYFHIPLRRDLGNANLESQNGREGEKQLNFLFLDPAC
jgi:preprotein translocase subunit SecG